MATVAGAVERARAFFPERLMRRRREELPSVVIEIPARKVAQIVESVLPDVVAALPHGFDAGLPLDIPSIAISALDPDPARLIAQLESLLARGMTIDAMFVTVLAPTARHLGVMWEEDVCDFVEVTMGLWRLQEIVREFSARTTSRRREGQWRALFAPFPGEQHNFGAIMVEDVFRRDGWDTDLLLSSDRSELIRMVAGRPLDLVGLTVSCQDHIGALPSLLRAIRSVTGKPGLCIMLGGHAVSADPDLVTRVGADCTAASADTATQVAARFVSANACREAFTA